MCTIYGHGVYLLRGIKTFYEDVSVSIENLAIVLGFV